MLKIFDSLSEGGHACNFSDVCVVSDFQSENNGMIAHGLEILWYRNNE